VILGGGFGGVYTTRHLERLCRRRPEVEIVLVSRDNFLLMTPLLFEVLLRGCWRARHCSFPLRAFPAEHTLHRSRGSRASTWTAAWFT